jgi:predicted DNA-binding ArsR family transcriptional regulator
MVAGESQRSDGRPAGRSICALQNNKLKFLSEIKSVSTYYIGSSCVIITLEILDKYRMLLSKWRTHDSIPAKTNNTLLQKVIFAFKYNKAKVSNIILDA